MPNYILIIIITKDTCDKKINYYVPCCQTSLGTMIGGSLLIANHLVQSLSLANQKQGIRQISQPHHIYYTLLWWVLVFAMPFSSISKQCKNAGPKPWW
jgi:hypothetical protein